MPVQVRCALCGAESSQNVLASTSTFGPTDLDLRPNGPARWALQFQVHHCPDCGYCAERIGERTLEADRVVASLVYRDVLEQARMPALARHFFCAALVAEAAERRDAASTHFLEAAWACDDARAAGQARICRDRAAEMLASAIEWGDVPTESPLVHGVRADLLRRAGRYDEAIGACAAGEATLDPASEEQGRAATVLAFIRELAEAGATKRTTSPRPSPRRNEVDGTRA
jgi:hypothetical protein